MQVNFGIHINPEEEETEKYLPLSFDTELTFLTHKIRITQLPGLLFQIPLTSMKTVSFLF
jgi:hypothetical protein